MEAVNYATHSYPDPLPKDGQLTSRQENFKMMANIAILLGSGVLLASLSTSSVPLVGAGIGIICISYLLKRMVSKIDEVIACQGDKNPFMTTRLAVAAKNANYLMVKILLFFGANPNETHSNTHSPALHSAIGACASIHLNPIPVIESLLNAGADIKQFDSSGHQSPLNHALDIHNSSSADEAVGLLLKWGANPNDKARPYDFALFKAAINGKTSVIPNLMAAGADIDSQQQGREFDGETALFAAIHHAHFDTVKQLIHYGASKAVKNAASQTPKDVATSLLQQIESNMLGIGFDTDVGAKFDSRPKEEIITSLKNILLWV